MAIPRVNPTPGKTKPKLGLHIGILIPKGGGGGNGGPPPSGGPDDATDPGPAGGGGGDPTSTSPKPPLSRAGSPPMATPTPGAMGGGAPGGGGQFPEGHSGVPPEAVNYHDGTKKCSLCEYMDPTGNCSWLNMPVDPDGDCMLFEAKGGNESPSAEAAEMGGAPPPPIQ